MTLQAIRPEDFPWFPYEGFTFCLGLSQDDAAWTSGHTAAVFDEAVGKMTVGGPMESQARVAYEKVLVILEAAGLGPQDVTRITENVTIAGLPYYQDAAGVRTELFGERPTVRTVIVERLVRSAAYLEVELHAVRGGGEQLVADGGSRSEGHWQSSPVTVGHDGLVYFPTLVPIRGDGDVIAPGDFAAQYGWCLDRAEDLLAAAGLSLDRVVTTYDYVTPKSGPADRAAAETIRRERLAPDGIFPAAGRIEMSSLHRDGVLVAIDVTASRHSRRRVDPGWSAFDGTTRSPAVRAGRSLFLSGMAARDTATGEVVAADHLEGQAETLYQNLVGLLAHENLTPGDLLETTEYCVVGGLPTYRVVAPVREKWLSPPWPSSTGAICHGLDQPGLMLEVFPNALYREGA